MPDWLIYGAYGYTGELCVAEALRRGLRPVLAGRDEARLRALAERYALPWRAFSLDDNHALERGLAEMRAVLHCAGPFSRTAVPMAEACLRARLHYADITGEISVFEALAAKDAQAKAAGVMVLPGAGFDVVPSDCLARYLKELCPEADTLRLAFHSLGRPSHGTQVTILEHLSRGGCIRERGALKQVPAAWKCREIDFGEGSRTAVSIPWGDVSTAFRSTAIPNIEVYMTAPESMRKTMRWSNRLKPLLGLKPVRKWLQDRVKPGGPDERQRNEGYVLLWGEAVAPDGKRMEAWLRTPEAYTFTARTAVRILDRILGGDAPPGYQTPSTAYGADFVLEFDGVSRRMGV